MREAVSVRYSFPSSRKKDATIAPTEASQSAFSCVVKYELMRRSIENISFPYSKKHPTPHLQRPNDV